MAHTRDDTEETAEAMDQLRDHGEEAAESLKQVRDASIEDDVALDGVRDRAEESASALSRLRDKAIEAAGALTGLGAAADAAKGADAAGGGGMGGMVYLIGALVIAIAGVLPAVAAMGASIGAFAGFAIPTFEKVWKAASSGKAAIDALPAPLRTAAEELKGLENEYLRFAKAFQTPVAQIMSQALGIASDILPKFIPLAMAGAKAVSALLTVLDQGLRSTGFTDFLALMTKMAVPATIAITHLLGALMGFLGTVIREVAPASIPFTNFLTTIVKDLTGPLAAALKLGVELLTGLGKALEPLLPMLMTFASVLLNDVGSSFMELVPLFKTLATDLVPALHAAIKGIEPVFANLLTPNSPLLSAFAALLKVLPDVVKAFTQLMNFIDTHPFMTRIAVDILSTVGAIFAFQKVIGLVAVALKLLLAPVMAIVDAMKALNLAFGLSDPVLALIVIAIAALAVGLYELYEHSKLVRDIVHDVAQALKTAWDTALHAAGDVVRWFISGPLAAIKSAIADLAAWWKTHGQAMEEVAKVIWTAISTDIKVAWDLIVAVLKVGMAVLQAVWGVAWAIIKGVVETVWNVIKTIVDDTFHEILDIVGIILDLLTGHWHQAWEDMKALVSTVLNETVDVIGEILRGLVSTMYNAGVAAIMGLVHGIESVAGDVKSAIGGIAHDIAGAIGLSPAEYGPLSGSGAPEIRGRHFSEALAQGIISGRAAVQGAIRSLSGTMAYGGVGGSMTGATSAGVHVTVPVTMAPGMGALTSPQFLQGIQPVVQEAILRYVQLNQSSGIAAYNRRS